MFPPFAFDPIYPPTDPFEHIHLSLGRKRYPDGHSQGSSTHVEQAHRNIIYNGESRKEQRKLTAFYRARPSTTSGRTSSMQAPLRSRRRKSTSSTARRYWPSTTTRTKEIPRAFFLPSYLAMYTPHSSERADMQMRERRGIQDMEIWI